MRKLFKRSDFRVILAVLLLSLLLFLPNLFNDDKLTAIVTVDGKIIEEIELEAVEKSYTFSPKEGTAITVENGRICFLSASCRDELCVKSGWLSTKGQTAACLPEKIVITIKGADKTDMMTY